MAKSQRIFVGNLSTNTTENDIRNEFSAYGEIETVDFKTKSDPTNNGNANRFAFISINAHEGNIQQCLNKFQKYKLHGKYLTVSIAREHFLDRLKREREETTSTNGVINIPEVSNATTNKLNLNSSIAQRNKTITAFNSDSDDETTFKKTVQKANPFAKNKKIEVKQPAKEPSAHLATNRIAASEKKRIESLKKMKDLYKKKQHIIKTALTHADFSKNKIIFEDEVEQVENFKRNVLFDDDENSEDDVENNLFENLNENEMNIKYKLQKLNAKFGGNEHFKMDEHFLDDDQQSSENKVQKSKNEERDWQFGVLEKIIGHQLHESVPKKTATKTFSYDPTQNSKQQSKTKLPLNNKDADEQISKVRFYKISNDIKKSLQTGMGNFSLLNMFGVENENQITPTANESNREFCNETMLNINENCVKDTFNYDSTDEEDLDDLKNNDNNSLSDKNCNQLNTTNFKNNMPKMNQHGLSSNQDTFFFSENDVRFKDGEKFFLTQRNNFEEDDEIDFAKKRSNLKNVVKKKIQQAIKNKLPRGAKPNKRFKKYTRAL